MAAARWALDVDDGATTMLLDIDEAPKRAKELVRSAGAEAAAAATKGLRGVESPEYAATAVALGVALLELAIRVDATEKTLLELEELLEDEVEALDALVDAVELELGTNPNPNELAYVIIFSI